MTQTVIILYVLSCVIIISAMQSFFSLRQKRVGRSQAVKLIKGFVKVKNVYKRACVSYNFSMKKKMRNGIIYSGNVAKLFFVAGNKWHNGVYNLSNANKEIFEDISVLQARDRTIVLQGEVGQSCTYSREISGIKLQFREEVIGADIVKTLFIKNNSVERKKMVYINKIVCNTNDFIEQRCKGNKFAFTFDDTWLDVSCSSASTTSIKARKKPVIVLSIPITLAAKTSKYITLTCRVCKSIDAKHYALRTPQPQEEAIENDEYSVVDDIIYRYFNYQLPTIDQPDYPAVEMFRKMNIPFDKAIFVVNKHAIAEQCKSLLESILDVTIIERGVTFSGYMSRQIERFSLLHPCAYKKTSSAVTFKKVSLDGSFAVLDERFNGKSTLQKLAVFLYKRQAVFTKTQQQERGFLLTNHLDKTSFLVEYSKDVCIWKLNKELEINGDVKARGRDNVEIKEQVFGVTIKCADKKIEQLINEFLPDKIIEEYRKTFEFTSLFSFLDSQDKVSNYHHKYVVERFLRNKQYARLYIFLLRRVVGIQVLGSYVRFYAGSMAGNVAIEVRGHKMIKSNDKGTRVVYNVVIYNNVYVLKLKNRGNEERVVRVEKIGNK